MTGKNVRALRARGAHRLTPLPAPRSSARIGQWDDTPDTVELDLPSGKAMLVRRPDLPRAVRRGAVPDDLLPAVEHHALHGIDEALAIIEGRVPSLSPGQRLVATASFWAYVDALCVATAADPPLSFDGRPGTLSVARLSYDDRLCIWRWGAELERPVAPAKRVPNGEGAAR